MSEVEVAVKEDPFAIGRFYSKDTSDYQAQGFDGWLLFGLLSTFNFMYFSDLFYERYVVNWMGLNPFFSDIFSTWWSLGQWIRILVNWGSWFMVMFIWTWTLLPGSYTADVWLFQVGGYGMGTLYLIRTAFLLTVWSAAFFLDDCKNSYCLVPSHMFKYRDSWGDRRDGMGRTDERIFLDFQIELATAIGLFVGIPLLAPRYHAAIKKLANPEGAAKKTKKKGKKAAAEADDAESEAEENGEW